MVQNNASRDGAHNVANDAAPADISAGNEKTRDAPPAALRARAEADERRRHAANQPAPPQELGGRGGLDPARYGDWEVKGLTSDF